MSSTLLWQPSPERAENSHARAFMRAAEVAHKQNLKSFPDLYSWSIKEPQKFWELTWNYCGVISSTRFTSVLEASDKMPGARWFSGAHLNFAENLLRFNDEHPALVFWGEAEHRREISYSQLREQASKVAKALKAWGIKPGDRIAAFMPNMPETIVTMLAAASLGAVWSSCSPDFGVSGVLDRFGQIEPKVLLVCDGYFFKGQVQDCLEKAAQIGQQLPSVEHCLVVRYTGHNQDYSKIKNALAFDELLKGSAEKLKFEQLPFAHPLYIMFSSGTTGKPKCIVHSAGGTLIEHLKELILHTNLKRNDRIFYQTTCGWMMWNWLVTSLACGATLILFDGAPFHNKGKILFDLAEKERLSIFGTNAKYISALEKEGLAPVKSHDLSSLHSMLSTGSPLAPEGFDYVYSSIKKDLCLSSICGGTDIIGCFMLGSPMLPVYRGEIQTRSLGMRVEVFDESGRAIDGQKGELVCSAPFPSMPISFWGDADGKKYKAAYFERFKNIWHHGDYIELTQHGGIIVHGRSDSVLNPGGIRIGTSEIYRQVEKLPQIAESIVIAQDWQSDVRVVLFVKLQAGLTLDDALREAIRSTIRKNTSPFHVPKKILQVADIPRTRSGKIVELAVRNAVHGTAIKNIEALANPEALDLFKNLAELQID